MVFTSQFGNMGCQAVRTGEGVVLSRERCVSATTSSLLKAGLSEFPGVTLGSLDFVPNLFLTIVEPCISYPTTITQMESFFTVELSGEIFHFSSVWAFSNVQPVGRPIKGREGCSNSMNMFGLCLWSLLSKAQAVPEVERKLWVSVFVGLNRGCQIM